MTLCATLGIAGKYARPPHDKPPSKVVFWVGLAVVALLLLRLIG